VKERYSEMETPLMLLGMFVVILLITLITTVIVGLFPRATARLMGLCVYLGLLYKLIPAMNSAVPKEAPLLHIILAIIILFEATGIFVLMARFIMLGAMRDYRNMYYNIKESQEDMSLS